MKKDLPDRGIEPRASRELWLRAADVDHYTSPELEMCVLIVDHKLVCTVYMCQSLQPSEGLGPYLVISICYLAGRRTLQIQLTALLPCSAMSTSTPRARHSIGALLTHSIGILLVLWSPACCALSNSGSKVDRKSVV